MKRFLFFIVLLYVPLFAGIDAERKAEAMSVFSDLQRFTGLWSVELEISSKGKEVTTDRSNTIFVSTSIIDLCYKGVDSVSGKNRVALILAHELAHILNKDYDYDRFFDPFETKLTMESRELRKRKELNADIQAVSILLQAGYSIDHLKVASNNIIRQVYQLYGITEPDRPQNIYAGAAQRTKQLLDREKLIREQIKLLEAGTILLLSDKLRHNAGLLEIAAEAYEHFQIYMELNSPLILNNYALINFALAKDAFLRYFPFEEAVKRNPYIQYQADEQVITRMALESDTIHLFRGGDLEYYYRYKSRLNKADNLMQTCLNLVPDSKEVLLNMSLLKMFEGDLPQSRLYLDKVAKDSSEMTPSMKASLLNDFGILYALSGDTASAVRTFTDVLALDSQNYSAGCNLKLLQGAQQAENSTYQSTDTMYGKINKIIGSVLDSVSYAHTSFIKFGPKEKYNLQFIENNSSFFGRITESGCEVLRYYSLKEASTGFPTIQKIFGTDFQTFCGKFKNKLIIFNSKNQSFYSIKGINTLLGFNERGSLTQAILLR